MGNHTAPPPHYQPNPSTANTAAAPRPRTRAGRRPRGGTRRCGSRSHGATVRGRAGPARPHGGTCSGCALLRCMLRAGLLGSTFPQPGTVHRMLVRTWDSSVTEGRTSSPAGGTSLTGAGGRPKPPPRRPAAAAMLLSAARPPLRFRGRWPIGGAAAEYS